MGRKSKVKGARGELEAAEHLRRMGIQARRGRQYSGSPDSPDVQTALGNIHIEVKRCESLRLYPSLDQAENDSGEQIPMVLHRRNGKRWVAIIYLDDLVDVAADVVDTITAGVDWEYKRVIGLVAVQTAKIKQLEAELERLRPKPTA